MAAIKSGWGKKLTGRLADYANATKGTLLLGDIQAHMIKEAAKPSTRRQDVVHPSEVAKTGWCPRSTYLRIAACREASNPFLKPAESIAPQLLNIFDEGHYIHDKWQKRLRDMGDLWGNWECESCGQFVLDALYPSECSRCNSTRFAYKEVPLFVRDLLISGHADGAIPRVNGLIEIKSVGTGTARIEAPDIFAANSEGQKIDLQGLWRDIKEPFPAHIRQGQLYLWICHKMGLPFDRIVFLYESKFNQGAKEFVTYYDYNIVKPLVESIENLVNALNGLRVSVDCPYNGCKDCDIYYGSTTVAIGLGNTPDTGKLEGSESSRASIRRSPGSTKRIIRPS